jgi:uncharacterized membrane protein
LSANGQSIHVEQAPPAVRMADEQVGSNGRIAAALTRWVGSMWALYFALAIVGGWMAVETWAPLHSVDPYPFPFMLFLNNVVQLVLCLAILVGQRVLGMAADARALQTYRNAEAIFAQVSDLQNHLDRQDRMLSRGISLLEEGPHPWIEQHRVQPPPQAKDQVVSLNGRVAAWLTTRLGSMWAFYAALATQLVWIGLWLLHVQTFDPYPFQFMTFLSTLAQLVFMIVIMVGQDVLGHAADRRSEQTSLDTEAILFECGRMKARLTAQDRIINRLCEYTNRQVTERLARAIHDTYARAIHEAYVKARIKEGEKPRSRAATYDWDELSEEFKESNRAQARDVGEKLRALGCFTVPATDPQPNFAFDDRDVEKLAEMEHERWMRERSALGYVHGPVRRGRFHPDLVPWDVLPEEAREKDRQAVRSIPALLAAVGFEILRANEPVAETA